MILQWYHVIITQLLANNKQGKKKKLWQSSMSVARYTHIWKGTGQSYSHTCCMLKVEENWWDIIQNGANLTVTALEWLSSKRAKWRA